MQSKEVFWNTISVICLVAGTCIGGGMIALPVSTSYGGFIPSVFFMLIAWTYMTLTGLLILEANLWMKEKSSHVISMASHFLGKGGKVLAWIIYAFIGYASLIAYISGAGPLVQHVLSYLGGKQVSLVTAHVIFVVGFGLIIYLGAKLVGRINAILFIAMMLAYFLLIGIGIYDVKPYFLQRMEWAGIARCLPLLLTAFSFHTIVPSLTPYLKERPKLLRTSIIVGTSIPFIFYLVWQAFVLGTVPYEGEYGLHLALQEGNDPTNLLKHVVSNAWIAPIAQFFSFFAIVTSFIGIAFGLFDFLSDGLKIKEKGGGKLFLWVLVFVPCLFFSLSSPRAFLIALQTSGGFGDSILNGIMPALMVWVGRYRMQLESKTSLKGGRFLLGAIILFSLWVIFLEAQDLILGYF